MIESWWQAHELEFLLWGALLAVAAVLWVVSKIAEIRAARAKQREDGIR